jgi:ParB/RepB/Spo0J family partition protein
MKIEIAKIRFNPENPRHFITDESIDSIARSIKAEGQQEPVKVRGLQDGDDGSDGCTGKEKAIYELVEGERRTRGMLKIGATHIEAEVLTGSRLDFLFQGISSNQGEPYHWLDRYRNVEKISKAFPDMTQQEIADRLEMPQKSVSCAQRLMPVLSEAARQQIYVQDVKSDGWKTSERPITALLGLATGQPDDQNRVEQALKKVLDRKMTEQQAKALVKWVKQGNTAESFGEGGRPAVAPDSAKATSGKQAMAGEGGGGPDGEFWEEMCETGYFQIKRSPKGGIHIIIPDMSRAKAGALGVAGAIWTLEHPDFAKASSGKLADLGNPYWADLPGMIQKIKAGEVEGNGKIQEQPSPVPSPLKKGEGGTAGIPSPVPSPLKKGEGGTAGKPSHRSSPVSKGEGDTLTLPKTQGNDGSSAMSMLHGMLGQEPDSLTGKVTKAAVDLGVKGVKKLWKKFLK